MRVRPCSKSGGGAFDRSIERNITARYLFRGGGMEVRAGPECETDYSVRHLRSTTRGSDGRKASRITERRQAGGKARAALHLPGLPQETPDKRHRAERGN